MLLAIPSVHGEQKKTAPGGPEAVAFFRVSYQRGSLEALRGEPVINLLANLVLLQAIELLKLTFELFTTPIDGSEVISSELAPLGFELALKLLPTALNTVPIHG
jgi:hypothetical protein